MSTLDEDGITTDDLLNLLRLRVRGWESADSLRKERESAEAFTRAFAELDAALKDGARLPLDWAKAKDALLSRDTPEEAGLSVLQERFGSHEVLLEGKKPSEGESGA